MEPILSAGLCPAPAEGRGDISACLYHFLRGRREQLGRLGDAFLYRDPYGVARFAPGSGFNPLRELDEKDFSEFLMAMMADEGWDHLILDWGSAFDRLMACWLPHSARIIGIHREDSVKGLDPQTWAGRLKESLHLDEKKMITVVNFAGGGEGEPSGRSLPDAVRIPRDCGDFKRAAAGVEISLTNAFGMGIKALTDRICGVHTKEEKGCNEQDYTFKARNVGWNHLSDGWEL